MKESESGKESATSVSDGLDAVAARQARLEVAREEAGLRLDGVLARRFGGLSRMRIASLVARGACLVNGRAAHAGLRVRAGDAVELTYAGDGAPSSMTPEDLPLEILHEDDELLVVVKPSGMLVHPTRGVKLGTLANALTFHLNRACAGKDGVTPDDSSAGPTLVSAPPVVRPGIVHRLDRDTSGLMVVARTQRALSILTRHFQERLVEKRYLALLEGRVPAGERLVSAPIGRDPSGGPLWCVTPEGKPAQTRLLALESRASCSLVELEPLTGRTNQLRVHCAHVGHAVVGDTLYGRGGGPRLCLHASRLAFNHPAGGRRMEFVSPLPAEIEELFARS